ncbi:UNVERIFIED_CONTAM: hypothetical protein FKN15_063472 [Acipenser sinensis]
MNLKADLYLNQDGVKGGEAELKWLYPNGMEIEDGEDKRFTVDTIDETSITLLINSAEKHDNGIYTCVSTFEDGTEKRVTVKINVVRKEKNIIIAGFQVQGVASRFDWLIFFPPSRFQLLPLLGFQKRVSMRQLAPPPASPVWWRGIRNLTSTGPDNVRANPGAASVDIIMETPKPIEGAEILRYKLQWREEEGRSQWRTTTVEANNSLTIAGLLSDTSYEVRVAAINKIGEGGFSEQNKVRTLASIALSVSEKPGVGTGGIVGIVMVIFLVLLVAVDTTCYFTNHCGLMMCIAVNLLGKRPPGAKGLDEEERNVSTVQRMSEDIHRIRGHRQTLEQLTRKAEVEVGFGGTPASGGSAGPEPQILDLIRSHPPNHMLGALEDLASRRQAALREKTARINVSRDVLALRFCYESQRLQDVSEEQELLPSVKWLLQEGWSGVEESGVSLVALVSQERELSALLDTKRKESALVLAGDSQVALGVFDLELQLSMVKALRDCLQKQCQDWAETARGKQGAILALQHKWQSIMDFRQLVDKKQEQIRGLIKGNSTAKAELVKVKAEDRLQCHQRDVALGAQGMHSAVSTELRQFGGVSLAALSRRNMDGCLTCTAEDWASCLGTETTCDASVTSCVSAISTVLTGGGKRVTKVFRSCYPTALCDKPVSFNVTTSSGHVSLKCCQTDSCNTEHVTGEYRTWGGWVCLTVQPSFHTYATAPGLIEISRFNGTLSSKNQPTGMGK